MKMLFKQRLFSWFDSYDIYDEYGNTLYTVKGQLAWGHLLKIFDAGGRHVGTVKQQIFTFLPKFELYLNDAYVGQVVKEFTFFKPKYHLDCQDWQIIGDLFEWDYQIQDRFGGLVATMQKQLFNWTDTYSIDVARPEDAIYCLMIVLAIDAVKCSKD